MWQTLRNHRVLLISFGVLMLGAGLQNSLIALKAKHNGFSSLTIGLIMASFYLGFLISSLFAGRYVARVGHIRVFAALSSLCSITILFHGLWVNPTVWIIIRFVTGFCISGLYILCESWLNTQSANHQRGLSLAIYTTVAYIALSLSQLFLFLNDEQSFLLFALVSVFISLSSLPMLLAQIKAPELPKNQSTMRFIALYRRSPLGIIGLFCASFTIGSINSLAVIYASNAGYNDQQSGYIVMALNFGCVLLMSPMGKLSDVFDRRLVLCIAAALTAICSLFAIIYAHNLLTLLVFFLILGGLCLPLNSICSAYINDWLHPDEVLPATGRIVVISGVASIFGPLTTGFLMDFFSNKVFFYVNIAVMTFFALFALYRMTQRSNSHALDNSTVVMASINANTFSYAYDDKQLSFDFNQKK